MTRCPSQLPYSVAGVSLRVSQSLCFLIRVANFHPAWQRGQQVPSALRDSKQTDALPFCLESTPGCSPAPTTGPGAGKGPFSQQGVHPCSTWPGLGAGWGWARSCLSRLPPYFHSFVNKGWMLGKGPTESSDTGGPREVRAQRWEESLVLFCN